ncbi:unnamed protein product [Rotaria sp. Silwood2]|nr:unnamed protein product [Rotaria sp. Silwood2]
MTTFIDLRLRDDGFINTSPVASVVSPQYAVVNTSTQIRIPVSDANAGDDVRCRWSKYTPGVNRRRRLIEDKSRQYESSGHVYKKLFIDAETVHIRKGRDGGACDNCDRSCARYCPCSCSACIGTNCTGSSCSTKYTCPPLSHTTVSTTIETPGTIASTLSYGTQQAIDECGGICYPNSLPNGTMLSNCTLSFIGLVPGTWYAVAVQVEDFINESSNTPMSSVPVQFLIYVMPQPFCQKPPVIVPFVDCMEVLTGVSKSFSIYAMTMCDPNDVDIAEFVITSGITGMVVGSLTKSTSNSSLSYRNFTWTPQTNQIGLEELCMIVFTDVQSAEYCITFDVVTSLALCAPTTTTTTTTTESTTTSISTTSTTKTSTTSTTSTSTTSTTSTSTTMIPAARRRRRKKKDDATQQYKHLLSSTQEMAYAASSELNRSFQISKPNKNYRIYNILNNNDSTKNSFSLTKINGRMPTTTIYPRSGNHVSIVRISKTEYPLEIGNVPKEQATEHIDDTTSAAQPSTVKVQCVKNVSNKNKKINPEAIPLQELRVSAISTFTSAKVTVTKLPRSSTLETQPNQTIDDKLHDHKKNQHNFKLPFHSKSGNVEVIHISTGQLKSNRLTSSINQRSRSSDIDSVNVQKWKRPTVTPSKPDTFSASNKIKAFTTLAVVKIPKNRSQSS